MGVCQIGDREEWKGPLCAFLRLQRLQIRAFRYDAEITSVMAVHDIDIANHIGVDL
jgi:hypothetical protein